MKKISFALLSFFILYLNIPAFAQTGGNGTYEFLNLSNSARIASMGSNFLAIQDHDIALAVANPSLISPKMHNNLGLSFVDYYDDVNYGFVTYGRDFGRIGTYAASLQFIDYGRFKWADETGQVLGEFNANELAFTLGWGRSLDSNFSIGANFKMIYSALESYNSFGVAVDVAGSYHNPESRFTASLIAKNIGYQIVSYYGSNHEPLPFEIQLALSKRLEHMPFRYSIVFTNLQKWDLTYPEPGPGTNGNGFGETSNEKSGVADFADKFMRHVVLGGEFFIGNNLSLRLGYNYQRRQELKVDTKVSTVGFSWGFGIRISKFHFSYARSTYHLVGSPNYITITTDLGAF